jgi:hypothetical protein
VEERRRHSNASDKTKLPTKKTSVNKIPSDLEIQIQKTKKRFQNNDAIFNKTVLPECSIETIKTGNLSSSEDQELNKSSSSIEILEVSLSDKYSQAKDSEEKIVIIDSKSPTSSEDIKVSNDDNKEELNLRLIALKSAIQAKYGKGKNLKGQQKQNEVLKDQQKTKVEGAVDINVEPVDMDLSVTDDEKEENNFMVSDIPVIINTNSINQAAYLMFASHLETQNWNHVINTSAIRRE